MSDEMWRTRAAELVEKRHAGAITRDEFLRLAHDLVEGEPARAATTVTASVLPERRDARPGVGALDHDDAVLAVKKLRALSLLK